jgi:phenylacetic acid degradation operon negative regulatory protein
VAPAPSSANDHLLTVLGEFVLPENVPVWTSTFVDALGTLDIEESSTRQALNRADARGILRGERVGRRTRWHLTDRAMALLTDGTERIYTFHHRRRTWDGRWVLMLVSVPEARRDLRYRLRVRLEWAGFAALASGTWICPWVDRLAEAERVLEELGLEKTAISFVGPLGPLGDPVTVAATAWDLPSLQSEYEQFVAAHTPARQTVRDETAFRMLTRLVHTWRRLPFIDPDLPSELLPKRWSGERAGALFHTLHDRWKPAALTWWRERTVVA